MQIYIGGDFQVFVEAKAKQLSIEKGKCSLRWFEQMKYKMVLKKYTTKCNVNQKQKKVKREVQKCVQFIWKFEKEK